MKLAFCAYVYFPFGGLQKNLLMFSQACVNAGHKVTVFVGRWEGSQPDNIEVIELGHRGFSNPGKNRYYFNALQKKLRQQAFDLVLGFNRMPMLDVYYAADVCFADRIANKPNWLKKLLPRYRNYLQWEAEVFNVQSSTHILTTSDTQKNCYQQYYRTTDERFHLIPPGINPQFQSGHWTSDERHQRKAAQRSALGIGNDTVALFFIGSGYQTKGLDRAIEALASLRKKSIKVHLYVVGKDKASAYQQLANKLNLEPYIQFLGGRDDLPTLIQAADLLLHPARFESTGNVLLEAVIAGVPVVCTAVCGFSGYVKAAKAGIVLPMPFQQIQFTEAIEKLTAPDDAEPLRRQYAEAGASWGLSADIYRRYEYVAAELELIANNIINNSANDNSANYNIANNKAKT